MKKWTRRSVIGSGAAALGGAALAGEDRLAALLFDGPDGLYSAGLIARLGDGRMAIAASAGLRTLGAAPHAVSAPFGLDDPFRVASVSKMIAATGFMPLVETGRVALDDDAGDRLGFRLRHPAYPDRPITIQNLMSHTSGLRNGPSYPVPAGHALKEAFLPSGRHFDGGAWFGPPDKAPGEWFAYADVNFCVIAQIIERLSGERFDRYMTRTVLAPLGLDAGYNWSGVSQAKRDRAASARRWLNGRWTAQVDEQVPAAPGVVYPQPQDAPPLAESELRLGENGFLFAPQGGLRVSLQDMDRLARFYASGGVFDGHRLIRRQSLERMQTAVWRYDRVHPNGDTGEGGSADSVFGGYGLGVEVPQGAGPPAGDAFFGASSPQWRGHLGDAYGWLTGLFWNRHDGRTLVYALNGMRETGRAAGRRSALTIPEERVIDLALLASRNA